MGNGSAKGNIFIFSFLFVYIYIYVSRKICNIWYYLGGGMNKFTSKKPNAKHM